MGTFNVSIHVGGPSGSEFRPVDALVATGASHTILSRSLLTALGVVVIEQVAFRLADERTVEHDVGEARIRLDGRERTTLVIFGPDDAEPLLGATTLQLFNMAVVTIGERLFSVPGLLKRSIPPEMHDAAKLANSTT
jgi:clan AA aspartic protease